MKRWQVPGRRTKTGLQLCSRTLWKRSRHCDSQRTTELKEMRGMSEEVWAGWKSNSRKRDNVASTARKEVESQTEEHAESSSELSHELNYKENVKLWKRSSGRSWPRRDSWDKEIKVKENRVWRRCAQQKRSSSSWLLTSSFRLLLLLIILHLTSAGWIYRVPSKDKEQQIVHFFQFE